LNWSFSPYDQPILSDKPPRVASDVTDGAVEFIELLIETVQESVRQAEADILKASVCNPGHGEW
jgi:hypothetical protein